MTFFADGSTILTYKSAEAASPLGCTERYQWCNSTGAEQTGCGPLASMYDAIEGAAPMFNLTADDFDQARPLSSTERGSLLIWPALMQEIGIANLHHTIGLLGAKSLASQSLLFSGTQYPLPPNQWQLDVRNWFNTVLASVQAMYVQSVQGVQDPGLSNAQYPPLNDQERKLCSSQVRSHFLLYYLARFPLYNLYSLPRSHPNPPNLNLEN